MACAVTHGGVEVVGSVTDTSSDGLRVDVPGGLPFSGVVTLALKPTGLRLDAEVRWRRGDQAGLRILRHGELGAAQLRARPTPIQGEPS
jgi:hypothetical protein